MPELAQSTAGVESFPTFTKPARQRWESIPANIRQRLLSNVWCGQCRHETTITNFSGTIKGGDLLQDILQIEVGIVSVELGGLDQTRQLSPDEML